MDLPPSRRTKRHDVFISFRGEDTRANFTSHLHSALVRGGIRAYIDNYLEKGQDVWPALSSAIGDSHMAVVVFSKNYASSKWCLNELVKILECRETEQQVVIPVFCEVDPSDVRKQTGTYEEAFGKHQRELRRQHNNEDDRVQHQLSKWKAALTEAANISGRDTRSREYKNESEVIDKVVKDVLKKLQLRFPDETNIKDLVGFEKIRKDVELLLSENKSSLSLENVHAIGIWGMGGIGKTTIAKAMFSQLFPQYDSICFFENVREESQKVGQGKLRSLRDKLFSELLKDEHLNSMLSSYIERRLESKKVFIVLDDVDSSCRLDELCKECRHASPGSKLIITTRDRHVLSGIVEKDDIYGVKTWSEEESLELFCLSAFQTRHPMEGYEDLAKRAVDYAKGVPLALKVLGSTLRKRDTVFWDVELNKLKNYPHGDIENVLRVSYDGLENPEKKIFLDIAFFFKDENKDFVERILNACIFYASNGLKILEDKALITISSGRTIQMHDLIQEMGLNIVRDGIDNPGKRSRLRDIEEVSEVLEYIKKGSDAIEGIKLDLSQIDDLRLNANAFSPMTDLRFLKLYIPSGKTSGNMEYPEVLNEFSAKLRYLEWNGYRLRSLPETFFTKMLVEIRLPHSHITKLWHGTKNIVNLERIDLGECKHLENLPDLSKASKLKWVNLSGCESLAELHPSILSSDTLETLTLDGCKKLRSLKSRKRLSSLMKISVNGCTNLKEFSLSSDVMERLDLNNAGIEKLHSSIGDSRKLGWLNLERLRLQNLPIELSSLGSLVELRISNCRQLALDKQKLHALLEGLTSLQLLHLKDCCKLSGLPDNIDVLSQLRELRLDQSSVETLPASIKNLSKLEILSLSNCRKLKFLPELPTHIKDFYAVNCTSLVKVSSLNTFATVMEGKDKYVSFENCMKLDRPSLRRIKEGAQLTAINAIFQNVFVRSEGVNGHRRHNYNYVKFSSPGGSVPKQFTYRSTRPTFTVDLPSDSELIGLVMCAILSPSDEIKKHGAKIFCQFYKADGTKVSYAAKWYHEAIWELNGDHIFIWYTALHFDSTVSGYEQQLTVEFYVTNDLGERDVLNIFTKECGVRLILKTELYDLLRKLDLEFEAKWQLGLKLGSELGLELESELQRELESQHRASSTVTETSDSDENGSNDKNNILPHNMLPLFPQFLFSLIFCISLGGFLKRTAQRKKK